SAWPGPCRAGWWCSTRIRPWPRRSAPPGWREITGRRSGRCRPGSTSTASSRAPSPSPPDRGPGPKRLQLIAREQPQEVRQANDCDLPETSEPKQMSVAGDDEVGPGGERAFENPVVGLVGDDIEVLHSSAISGATEKPTTR